MENYSAASDSGIHFDKTVTLSQNGKEIEYGIIDGLKAAVMAMRINMQESEGH